jgi:feruloyl esterase
MTPVKPATTNLLLFVAVFGLTSVAEAQSTPQSIAAAACAVETLGDAIPAEAIGEPVSAVTLNAPVWNDASAEVPAHCSVDGVMAPVEPGETSRPINFRVVLPASWNGRSAQLGGGGMNGTIPNLTGSVIRDGFVTYGSDSGHQLAAFGRGFPGARGAGAAPARGGQAPGGRGPAPAADANNWTLNDEAIRNLGYMQMKKTHDAAMVLMDRMYGAAPEYNYYIGSSQGGREALMVASRYPDDYDGITANVPIVGFSSLMLAPELIRIQEKPTANWVPPAKVNAIRGEFMRQCDGLDGRTDGVINNYMACRDIFDVSDNPGTSPWAAKRCPNNIDPNPDDAGAGACLTDGQIDTLEMIYRPYAFATPLAHEVASFGMWVPNTDPSGSGLLLGNRFRGQEGAAADAPMHSHLGVLGVTGFLMGDLDANPLDYVEGGQWEARRMELSGWLDASNPDFSAFTARGGKMIVTIGTNDTLASPGAQLDFYASVLETMGRDTVDQFARFFVLPQTGHGLTGNSYTVDGDGNTIEATPVPSQFDRVGLLTDWVERGMAPGKSVTVSSGERTGPMCSYPEYPRYVGGPEGSAGSYTCAEP